MLSYFPFGRVLKASTETCSRTFQPVLANTVTLLQMGLKKNNISISKMNLFSLFALNYVFVSDIVPTRTNQ